MYHSKALYAC